MDIDNFKQINDTRGHAAGDHTLITLATAVRGAIRSTDHIARIGGDEFVVLLPGMDTGNTHSLIGRLQLVADCPFSYGIAHSVPRREHRHPPRPRRHRAVPAETEPA